MIVCGTPVSVSRILEFRRIRFWLFPLTSAAHQTIPRSSKSFTISFSPRGGVRRSQNGYERYLRLSEGPTDEPSRFGPQAIGWGQRTASTVFRGRERVRDSGLGKPQLLTGEAGVLPLACPAVDGDGKKANTTSARFHKAIFRPRSSKQYNNKPATGRF